MLILINAQSVCFSIMVDVTNVILICWWRSTQTWDLKLQISARLIIQSVMKMMKKITASVAGTEN